MRESNPFENPLISEEWISGIESPKASVRDRDIYPRLRDWVNRVDGAEILDIGCGQGVCSSKIDLTAGRSYTGVEPAPVLLERAHELYGSSRTKFVRGNAYELPFPDQTFDAAFSVALWHLLRDPGAAACELARILKPRGHFLIITANPSSYDLWTGLYMRGKLEGREFAGIRALSEGTEITEVLYLHALDEIAHALQNAGLEVQSSETFRSAKPGQDFFLSITGRKP